MSDIVLYCPEPLGLKLGPGSTPEEVIGFHDGFARFDSEDFPDWRAWVEYRTTPHIEILDAESDQVPANMPDAHICAVCGKAFTSKRGLQGHLMSHVPKKG